MKHFTSLVYSCGFSNRHCRVLMITKESINLKHIVVYENSLDRFDIDHCKIKWKVTVCIRNVLHLQQYKLLCPQI